MKLCASTEAVLRGEDCQQYTWGREKERSCVVFYSSCQCFLLSSILLLAAFCDGVAVIELLQHAAVVPAVITFPLCSLFDTSKQRRFV